MNAKEHYNAMVAPFIASENGKPDPDLIDFAYLKPAPELMGPAHLCAALDRMTAAIEAQTAAALPYYAVAIARLEATKKGTCRNCFGTGRWGADGVETCPECKGTGTAP